MPPKKQENKERFTRSRSSSRARGQGPRSADPHAPTTPEEVPLGKSPSRDEVLPSEESKQNNSAVGAVSIQERISSPVNAQVTGYFKNNNSLEQGNTVLKNSGQTPQEKPALADFPKMGDNKEASNQTDISLGDSLALLQQDSVSTLTSDIKAIRSRMDKLDNIETSISSLVTQLGSLIERTGKMESKIDSNASKLTEVTTKADFNSSKITEVTTEVASLKETVALQGEAIAKLINMKAELLKQNKETKDDLVKQNTETKDNLVKKNKEITKEMNSLLGQQKVQVESFTSTTKRIENNICERVEKKIEERIENNVCEIVEKKMEEKASQASQEASFISLKDQAFAKRHNLIITGLKEDEDSGDLKAVKDLFKTIGVGKVGIHAVYRLGTTQSDNTSYNRPTVVEFTHLSDRNKVWRKRACATNKDNDSRIKIQADLPKFLRDEMNILYRVVRAAAKTEEFKDAAVKNYAVLINGKEYIPGNLECLPPAIRPSLISNPRSDSAIVFFSKYSPLSNHHHSPFQIQGKEFKNMEQYLATQRATLSGKKSTIQRATTATDPKEAKAILRSLREDHSQEWSEKVEAVTIDGLRAKFTQNQHLGLFLKNTQSLQIGEASRDSRWGIGLDLNDPGVLDMTKWDPAGNLLGKCLMKIRKEISGSN